MAARTSLSDPDDRDAVYLEHRRLVFSLAYDITGSVADAEDVAQGCYERWRRATNVRDPRAWLARAATNLALDTLRARHRVDYVGPWLPEPIPERVAVAPTPEALEVRADEVSVALLLVLESLSPLERAAFLLVEVFGFGAPEAAGILGRQPAAVRQLVSRARRRLRRDRPPRPVDAAEHRRVVRSFIAAAREGDFDALAQLLGPEVVLITDGGGVVSAARRPVVGRDHVLGYLGGLATRYADRFQLVPRVLNGQTGWVLVLDEQVDHAVSCDVADGMITAIYLQRNPGKLDPLR